MIEDTHAMARAARHINRLVASWRARASERAALATMGPRELRDIGLSPGEAMEHARRPFWRA